tara:strand:- start:7675 stop:8505 length:831 start_codon:yes stop_codon:yes gene_type:complete
MKPIPSPVGKDAINLLQKAQRLLEKAEKLEMVEHEGKKVPAFAADGKGAKDMKTKASMAEKDKYCMKNFGKKYSECSAKEKAQCDKVHGKVEKGEGHEQKIISCLKKKGGAASLEECAKECGVSKAECKKIIDKMDNVKISPHGDVILMDGLQKGSKKCPECGEAMNKMGCMKMGCGGKMDVEKSEAGAQPGFTTSYDSNPGGVMFMAESGGQTRSAYYTTNQYLYGGDDVANKGSRSESVSFDKLSGQLNPHDGNGVDRQVVDGILSKMRDMMDQ